MEKVSEYLFLSAIFAVVVAIQFLIDAWLRRKRDKDWVNYQRKRDEIYSDVDFIAVPTANPNIKIADTKFLCFYGIKIALDEDNMEEFESCSTGVDPRCVKAKACGLETYTDRFTDGVDYFLYIGRSIASLNLESDGHIQMDNDQLLELAKNVDEKMNRYDSHASPSFYFQSIHEY